MHVKVPTSGLMTIPFWNINHVWPLWHRMDIWNQTIQILKKQERLWVRVFFYTVYMYMYIIHIPFGIQTEQWKIPFYVSSMIFPLENRLVWDFPSLRLSPKGCGMHTPIKGKMDAHLVRLFKQFQTVILAMWNEQGVPSKGEAKVPQDVSLPAVCCSIGQRMDTKQGFFLGGFFRGCCEQHGDMARIQPIWFGLVQQWCGISPTLQFW